MPLTLSPIVLENPDVADLEPWIGFHKAHALFDMMSACFEQGMVRTDDGTTVQWYWDIQPNKPCIYRVIITR